MTDESDWPADALVTDLAWSRRPFTVGSRGLSLHADASERQMRIVRSRTIREATMAETRRIPADQLTRYFDAFSKRFLMAGSPGAADIEVIGTDIGDQQVTSGARLLGVDYDPHTNALEIELDSGEHRAYQPREVWAIEEPDGFITGLQIVRSDGAREVVQIRRGGAEGHG